MVKDLRDRMPVRIENPEIMEVDLTSESNPCEKMNGFLNKVSNNRELILKDSNGTRYDSSSFLSSCKKEVLKSFRPDFESLMNDIDSSLKNASGMLRLADEAAQKVSGFLSSHDFLFKIPPRNLKTHPKLASVSVSKHSLSNSNGGPVPQDQTQIYGNSVRKEPTVQDGLEILNTISSGAKINLPPVGEIKRNQVEVGTRVWAMKTNLLNVWVKGVVTFVREGPPDRMFKIKFDNQKYSQKFYTLKQLAYIITPLVIVPVGTRIIARYTDSGGRSAHYAGIIAEPPKTTNLKRYLIFFDDGCAQYVKHEDVYVVCAQSVDVADDVHENISDFVRAYLLQYPERPMVKLQKDQFVKTEYNCEWSDAKVLEVDCSMVKMLFLTSQRVEWIYRGSTRLKPLRSELANAEAHRMEGKSRRRHTAPRRPHQPYVEYTREDVVVIDSDSEDEKNVTAVTKPRNTARKSMGTRPLSSFNVRGVPSLCHKDQKSHLGYKEISIIKSFVRIPFHNHDCGIHCREKEDPAKYKGKNPLLIPIYLGWERQLRRFRASGPGARVIIIYRSPCGRHLRNLQDVLNYLNLVKSRVTIDLFSFNVDLMLFRTFRPKEVLYNDSDVTEGKENVPVSCVNSLSDDPPTYVEYSAERFPGEGVYLNLDPSFLCGCNCTDNCQNPATCACQQLTNYAKYGTNIGDAGYKFRRLTEPIVTGIYECNSICKCNSQCGNRVVQNGLTVRLQMFRTQFKGWGIRCLDDIDAGQFICVYAGQLLTEQGADADGKECGDEYLAELDHIEVVEKTKEGYESDVPEFDFSPVKEKKEEVLSSDDNFNSSDSDVLFADSDSEFESSLRSTATSTYATRSRRNGRKKSSPTAEAVASLLNSEDSFSSLESDKKDDKGLPDISNSIESFNRIRVRDLSPESSEVIDKIELKRKPKMFCKDEPMTDSENTPENTSDIKCEPMTDSQNGMDSSNSSDNKSSLHRVVAKKSVSMKMPMSPILDPKDRKYKSVRTYFGEDSVYIMDAKSKGNIGRYLNHSCEPNVFVQNVFVDTHDLRFPCVAFFAQNCIDAGTELTWDYNYEVGSVADKVMYCYCEAKSCRGRLL